MAQRKVEWSPEALLSLKEILDYYIEINGNSKYSKKLAEDINKLTSYIPTNTFLGKATDDKKIRFLVYHAYKIFYEIKNDIIEIQLVWDSHRNPEKLPI